MMTNLIGMFLGLFLLTAPATAQEIPQPDCVDRAWLEYRMQELNGTVDPKPIVIDEKPMVQSFIAYLTEKLGPPPGDPTKVVRVISWDLKDGTFATVFFDESGCMVINAKLTLDFLLGWDPVDPA